VAIQLGPKEADATQNSTTLNNAIAAQPLGQGDVFELPAGEWPIDRTILIEGKIGITLRGQGRHATTLYWVGSASSDSMIELKNSRACVIEEMAIRGPVKPDGLPDPDRAPFAAIESRRYGYPTAGYEGSFHVLRNLEINYSGTTRYGIVFSSSKNPACVPTTEEPNLCNADANNDFATLLTVTVGRAIEACFALMATQSVGHMLIACNFGGAKYAVACGLSDPARMDVTQGGGFTWIGGGVSSTVCDFFINWIGASGAVSITGVNSEASPRFFESAGQIPHLEHMLKNTISIRDCRVSTTPLDKHDSAATRIMVKHQAPGPLTLTGCTFHGPVIPIVDLLIAQPTVHHVTGNVWSMAGSDREVCIEKHVDREVTDPSKPLEDTPGGQYVIEEANVFLGTNDQLNSLGTVNQCRGVETFNGLVHTTQTVSFTSKEKNLQRTNEAFKPTNRRPYYVGLSVEVDENHPPRAGARHATISNLTEDSFDITLGGPPGPEKEVHVHWMIMR
jgi:hypothetical protein